METVLLFKDLENFRRLVSLIPNNFGRLILYSYSVFVTQSCLTLCNAMDCISPGSSVHGILQARIMEWVAIPFSRGKGFLIPILIPVHFPINFLLGVFSHFSSFHVFVCLFNLI